MNSKEPVNELHLKTCIWYHKAAKVHVVSRMRQGTQRPTHRSDSRMRFILLLTVTPTYYCLALSPTPVTRATAAVSGAYHTNGPRPRNPYGPSLSRHSPLFHAASTTVTSGRGSSTTWDMPNPWRTLRQNKRRKAVNTLFPQKSLPQRQRASSTLFASSSTVNQHAHPPSSSPHTVVQTSSHHVRYSDFLKLVQRNQLSRVTFSPESDYILAQDKLGRRMTVSNLEQEEETLLKELTRHKVDITVLPARSVSSNPVMVLVQSVLIPVAFLLGLRFLMQRSFRSGVNGSGGGASGRRNGNPNSPLAFGKVKNSQFEVKATQVNFDDVAGCEGAKLELEEVVDFLKHPEEYTKNGCRIPRGVILDGPPGTGKTLLAKAVAGEAQVPFLSISGSEFVEMFVGVGASRVRDMFTTAKANAPCIIFIDEIDAVGRQRGAGFAGGNDEREQTINQILVEMDGFEGNPGVITIAATNRVDILDQALLRPGRFDRKITVDLPDSSGRAQILQVHARGKPLESDVDLIAIARRTPGFSGAQLENLMNEAAISAARMGKHTIGWEEIDSAVDKIIVGLEKKGGTGTLSRRQNELVAYHEAGHAIVGALLPDYDQVQKITIIPRSNGAGGLTFFAPQESRLESGMYSRIYLEQQLVVALGGRLAEEIVFGEDQVTTGASNDFEQVANIAKRMVKEWGMSNKVGRIALSRPQGEGPFMGRMMGERRTRWGKKIMGTVDAEVERLVNNSYIKAKHIIQKNRKLLDHLAKTLVEQEVVSAEEFQMMIVEFNAKAESFTILGEDRRRDDLPFQDLPSKI